MVRIHGTPIFNNEVCHINCFRMDRITDFNEYTLHCLEVMYAHMTNSDPETLLKRDVLNFISLPMFTSKSGCTFAEILDYFFVVRNGNRTKDGIARIVRALVNHEYIFIQYQKYYKPCKKL